MSSLFTRKIQCDYCKKYHKKKNTKKVVYVCSTYDNFGSSHCRRNKVDEFTLLQMLELRYGKILTKEEIEEKVKLVSINEDKIEIIVYHGDNLILTHTHGSF